MLGSWATRAGLGAVVLVAACGVGRCQETVVQSAAPEQKQAVQPAPTEAAGPETMLGNVFGVRSRLEQAGVVPGLLLQTEYFRNPTGGFHQEGAVQGLATMSIGVDLEKAVGLAGGQVKISAFGTFGRGITPTALGALGTVSSNEAVRGLRLWEFWWDQSFFGGLASLRLGQQAADQEFFLTDPGSLFLNSAFGWPNLPSVDLPGGGPAYPLATPAVRLRVGPWADTTALVGIYSGDPAPGPGDPQLSDQGGVAFTVNRGAFIIGEVQHDIRLPVAGGLPGRLKIGAWHNTNTFEDQRFDTRGGKLASPDSNGVPFRHRGDTSVYGVWDQQVWRDGEERGVFVFFRASGAPDDRNIVSFEANPGVTLKGMVPGRPDDQLGIGYVYTGVSAALRAQDRDSVVLTGVTRPLHSAEQTIELTYQAAVRPWLVIQPDLQYWFNPGGGVPDPSNPAQTVPDALVIGVRTSLTF